VLISNITFLITVMTHLTFITLMLLVKHIRNAIRRIENTASAVLKGFLETTGGH